jgi:hypothetical protein
MASQDRKPLLAYLKVQESFERTLLTTLERVAAETRKEITKLAGKRGIGARVRQDQLRLTLKVLYEQQAELWKLVGSQVQAARAEALAAAVRTNFVYESVLLQNITSASERAALLRSATAQAEVGLDSVVAKLTGLTDYDLSKQVYKTEKLANKQVQNVIVNLIGRGASWKELSDAVRGMINPRTPGGVSYAAKRLGRTELNNAFHAGAIVEARNSPFIIGMEWHLSGSHPRPDKCNDYEGQTWKPENVPGKPHPQCLCYVTPLTPSREEFMSNFLNGSYDRYL